MPFSLLKKGKVKMPKFFDTLDKVKPVYDVVDKVLLFICKIFLVADILITSFAVAGRYIPFIPDPSWSEEVVLTCMSYMAVLSAALAIRRKAHIRMTAFDRFLPANLLKTLDIIADIAVLVLGIVMLAIGWQYASTIGGRGTYVSMPTVSRVWMSAPIPVAGFFMIIFELEAIVNDIKAFYRKDTEYDLKNQAERMIKEAQS